MAAVDEIESGGGAHACVRMTIESPQDFEGGVVGLAVLLSQRGDMEAVHFLYTRFASDVCSSVRDLVADDSEARCVAERIFRELPTLMTGYEVRKQVFAPWLLATARGMAGRPPGSCTKGRVGGGISWTAVDTCDEGQAKGLRS